MVRINLQPGSTMGARTIATVEVSARPEVRGRARCGTVNRLGDGTICVDLPGSTDSERRAIAWAVAIDLIGSRP